MDSAPKHAGHEGRQFSTDFPNGPVPVEADERPEYPASAEVVPAGVGKPSGLEPVPLSTTTGFPATRSPAAGAAPAPPPTAVPVWLLRVWLVIRVAFFIELGMVLVVLPWTRGWTENSLLLGYPGVRFFLQNYFVRGLVSGLGFIDIGFGIWEAVRYKEPPRSQTPSENVERT